MPHNYPVNGQLDAARQRWMQPSPPLAATAPATAPATAAAPSLDCAALLFVQRVIIYPNYLDNRKTVAQGRRIPKELGAARAGGSWTGSCEVGIDGVTHVRLPLHCCCRPLPLASYAACESPNAIEITEVIMNFLKLEAHAEVCRGVWVVLHASCVCVRVWHCSTCKADWLDGWMSECRQRAILATGWCLGACGSSC